MLLRRMIEHVKAQNWTAVGLDFFIVVVGVFIGIQLGNWNDARIREASADSARANLIANLRRDIEEFEEREAYYLQLYEHADIVLGVMNAPETLEEVGEWRFLESSFRLGQIWPFSQSRQVYRELEGKGDLDLIGGPQLRLALAEYYDSWEPEFGITVVLRDPFRDRVRQLMPISLQNHLSAACRGSELGEQSKLARDEAAPLSPARCPAPDEPALIAETAAALAQDRNLLELARGAVAQMNTTRSVLAMITNDAELVIAQIEAAE